MITQNQVVRLIFGLKVSQLREEKGLSPGGLSEKTGLSVSYLNEIEKGKKYPKADKIMLLAGVLGVEYDALVSLKPGKKLEPVIELLHSPFIKEFPLELFGIEPAQIIEMCAMAPVKTGAFIGTLMEIARNYEMRQEQFYFAALRSYQEMHDNYFEELEDAVDEFIRINGIDASPPFERRQLYDLLERKYGYSIDKEQLRNNRKLRAFRSVFIPGKRKLLINGNLTDSQKAFLLGREVAFNFLELKERPYTTTLSRGNSFEEVLNNFKASYFSVALLINQKIALKDIEELFGNKKWSSRRFTGLMQKYTASPEMFLQRLTNLLPRFFGIENLFFLRFRHPGRIASYDLTKELHLARLHNPHANELNEHYCRRWISLRIIQQLKRAAKITENVTPAVGIQISKYWGTVNEYLCISLAKPGTSSPRSFISVTIGFLVNENLKKKLLFLTDPFITTKWVNETCERCPISDCRERAADPVVITSEKETKAIEDALKNLD